MRLKTLFLFISFFIASLTTVFGQSDTCFKVDVNIGCLPLTVTVSTCASNTSKVTFNYGDDNKFYVRNTNTYTKAGVYDINLSVVDPIKGAKIVVLKNAVTVVDAKAPKVNITKCAGAKVKIEIANNVNQYYNKYEITYGDNTKEVLDNTTTSIFHTFSDTLPKTINVKGQILPLACGADTNITISDLYNTPLNPSVDSIISNNQKHTLYFKQYSYFTYAWQSRDKNNVWQNINTWKGNGYTPIETTTSTDSTIYRISNYDVCENKYYYTEELVMPFFHLNAQNQLHTIDFSTSLIPSSNKSSVLLKNDISVSNTVLPQNFTDTDVFCGVDYCYKSIYTTLNNTLLKGSSKCVKASSNIAPLAPSLVHAGLGDNGNFKLQLTIDPKTKVAKYNLFASEGTAPFTKTNTFTNDDIQTLGKENMCYKISIEDSCNNTSPLSEKVCPVWLKGNALGQVSYKLDFNNYISGAVIQPTKTYFIEYLQLDNTPYKTEKILTNSFTDNTPDTTSSITRYRIKTQVSGIDLYSNIVERKNPMKIIFPTAFTPNGDGINENFAPAQRFVTDYKLWIYSPTGNTIFFTDDLNKPWSGDSWPTGDYVYEFIAKDLLGNEITQKGIVSLLR